VHRDLNVKTVGLAHVSLPKILEPIRRASVWIDAKESSCGLA
jgi:hypothetical protein